MMYIRYYTFNTCYSYMHTSTITCSQGDHSPGSVKFPNSLWYSYPYCVTHVVHILLSVLPVHYKYQLSLIKPCDTLHHGECAANK